MLNTFFYFFNIMLFHSQCMLMIFHGRKYEETIFAIRYFHNNNDIDKFIIQFPFDAMLVAVDSIPYCNLRQWSEGCLDSEGYILQSRSTTSSGFPKAAVFMYACIYLLFQFSVYLHTQCLVSGLSCQWVRLPTV